MKSVSSHVLRLETPSSGWLAAGVALPLFVLAALALSGIRAQTRAAWSAARERAAEIAAKVAPGLAAELAKSVALAPGFPDPPVPRNTPPVPDDPLAGEDPAALARVRDDPGAGLSSSGLPRRVLAALRLMETVPNSQTPESVAALVTSVPSVLTAPVLEKLGDPAKPALARWREGETAISLAANGSGWQVHGGSPWWVERRETGVVYLTPDALGAALDAQTKNLPPWAGCSLRMPSLSGEENDAPLGTVPVPFGDGLWLDITAASPAMIEADVRKQAVWTLAVFGFAVASSAAAMFLMFRAVRRERKLAALKSQFVSSVSHELRAPIGSIRLMAEALHDGKVEGAPARDFHRLIAGESARLSKMVENVLDFARIEEGRKRYRFEETDLRQLAADTLRLMAPLAAERGITLVPELAPVTATADPAAIQQALVNLLDNAIKFSPEGGTVTATLQGATGDFPRDARTPRWSLAVADEGPGVPVAERDRVFERFYRIGNELRRETQGAGIGLSIVKHIVEAHGGKVSVGEGKGGRGSRFVIGARDLGPQAAGRGSLRLEGAEGPAGHP